mmetsp:Transcript_52514/g.96109  ORF Transcript_52514/g.96109 Transcript_52514/m.96109 type:complete len:205 (-) Transcript_52514:63-677(-)
MKATISHTRYVMRTQRRVKMCRTPLLPVDLCIPHQGPMSRGLTKPRRNATSGLQKSQHLTSQATSTTGTKLEEGLLNLPARIWMELNLPSCAGIAISLTRSSRSRTWTACSPRLSREASVASISSNSRMHCGSLPRGRSALYAQCKLLWRAPMVPFCMPPKPSTIGSMTILMVLLPPKPRRAGQVPQMKARIQGTTDLTCPHGI